MTQYNLDTPQLAETYDQISDFQFRRGSLLVSKLGIRPADTVLDLGAGTGRLGLHVVENLLSGEGRLIGLDPLPDRIALANSRNRYGNAHFAVGQAEDLSSIADGTVDVVYLSSVYHWIVDKVQGLREVLRVLKPGGKVGLTTAAREFQQNNTIRVVVDQVLSRSPYSGVVRVADSIQNRNWVTTTELIGHFQSAGLELVGLEVKPIHNSHPDGASVLDFWESSSFGNTLAHVPPELRDQARADIVAEFDLLSGGGPIATGNFGIDAIARRPVR